MLKPCTPCHLRLQAANLRLGLPVIVVHIVTPSSPLFDLSLTEMEARGLEIMWVGQCAPD